MNRALIVGSLELACVLMLGIGCWLVYRPLGFIVPAVLLLIYLQRFDA